jgi:hypothetical protein
MDQRRQHPRANHRVESAPCSLRHQAGYRLEATLELVTMRSYSPASTLTSDMHARVSSHRAQVPLIRRRLHAPPPADRCGLSRQPSRHTKSLQERRLRGCLRSYMWVYKVGRYSRLFAGNPRGLNLTRPATDWFVAVVHRPTDLRLR